MSVTSAHVGTGTPLTSQQWCSSGAVVSDQIISADSCRSVATVLSHPLETIVKCGADDEQDINISCSQECGNSFKQFFKARIIVFNSMKRPCRMNLVMKPCFACFESLTMRLKF